MTLHEQRPMLGGAKHEPDSGKGHGWGLYHVECPAWVPHEVGLKLLPHIRGSPYAVHKSCLSQMGPHRVQCEAVSLCGLAKSFWSICFSIMWMNDTKTDSWCPSSYFLMWFQNPFFAFDLYWRNNYNPNAFTISML